MFGVVLAVIGDSPGPSLALINSDISRKYVFFYTQEMTENATTRNNYLQTLAPKSIVEFVVIPSIDEPEKIIQFAQKFVNDLSDDASAAIFLTGGAKQVILPFYIHNPKLCSISLREGREHDSSSFLVVRQPDGTASQHITSIPLEQMLAIRGWETIAGANSPGLKNASLEVRNVSVDISKRTGRLIFYAEAKGLESPDKVAKKRKNKHDHVLVAELITLSESFGRNGASYLIRGYLTSRIKNVKPYFIRTEDRFWEEE
jgi:hypothetical protein